LPTQQATLTSALAEPPGFMLNTAHGGRISDLAQPHPTVCASDDRQSLIVPLRRNGRASPTSEAVPTVTASGNHHGLIVTQRQGQARRVNPTDRPLPVVTAEGQNHALLMRNNGTTSGESWATTPATEPARSMTTKGHQSLLVPYVKHGAAKPVTMPMITQTTHDRSALLDPAVYVDDCGFRMLEPYEVAAAMAFPTGYIPRSLSKKDQVKLAGNAVTPPVMAWLMGRVLQALEATT